MYSIHANDISLSSDMSRDDSELNDDDSFSHSTMGDSDHVSLQNELLMAFEKNGVVDEVKAKLRHHVIATLRGKSCVGRKQCILDVPPDIAMLSDAIMLQHIMCSEYNESASVLAAEIPQAASALATQPEAIMRLLKPIGKCIDSKSKSKCVSILCSLLLSETSNEHPQEIPKEDKMSLDMLLDKVEQRYHQEASTSNISTQSFEARLKRYQRECDARMQNELDAEVARIKTFETERVRRECEQRFEMEKQQIHSDLHKQFQHKTEILRESIDVEREELSRRRRELENERYEMRQKVLEDMRRLRDREDDLLRRKIANDGIAGYEITEQLRLREKELKMELESLKTQLEEAKSAENTKFLSWKEEFLVNWQNSNNSSTNELQQEIQSLKQIIRTKEDQINSLQNEKTGLHDKLSNADVQAQRFRTQIESFEVKQRILKQSDAQNSDSETQLRQALSSLRSQYEESVQRTQQLLTERTQLRTQLQSKQLLYTETQRSLENLQKNMHSKDEQIRGLKAAQSEQEMRISALNKQYQMALARIETLQTVEASARKQIADYSRLLSSAKRQLKHPDWLQEIHKRPPPAPVVVQVPTKLESAATMHSTSQLLSQPTGNIVEQSTEANPIDLLKQLLHSTQNRSSNVQQHISHDAQHSENTPKSSKPPTPRLQNPPVSQPSVLVSHQKSDNAVENHQSAITQQINTSQTQLQPTRATEQTQAKSGEHDVIRYAAESNPAKIESQSKEMAANLNSSTDIRQNAQIPTDTSPGQSVASRRKSPIYSHQDVNTPPEANSSQIMGDTASKIRSDVLHTEPKPAVASNDQTSTHGIDQNHAMPKIAEHTREDASQRSDTEPQTSSPITQSESHVLHAKDATSTGSMGDLTTANPNSMEEYQRRVRERMASRVTVAKEQKALISAVEDVMFDNASRTASPMSRNGTNTSLEQSRDVNSEGEISDDWF